MCARLVVLYAGLMLYGISMAMMIRAGLGVSPWDVFHQGLARHVPLSFGEVTIVTGVVVLLAWIPLRQWPGLGTVSNVVVIGVVVDRALAMFGSPGPPAARIALMVAAVVCNALATAMYIGARMGPGPRDGLMTGLVSRTGRSVRLVRTCIEVAVLVVGFGLGGSVGVGTLLYAIGVGPLIQMFMRCRGGWRNRADGDAGVSAVGLRTPSTALRQDGDCART